MTQPPEVSPRSNGSAKPRRLTLLSQPRPTRPSGKSSPKSVSATPTPPTIIRIGSVTKGQETDSVNDDASAALVRAGLQALALAAQLAVALSQ